MGLMAEAAAELINAVTEEGEPLTITSPSEEVVEFIGFNSDIHQAIDVGTGEIVTGRQVSVGVLLSDLVGASFEDIKGIPDGAGRPWLFTLSDAVGRSYTLKVVETRPDASMGMVLLFGEGYSS